MIAAKYQFDTPISEQIREAKEGDIAIFRNKRYGTIRRVCTWNPAASVYVELDIDGKLCFNWFDKFGKPTFGTGPHGAIKVHVVQAMVDLEITDIISRVSIKDLKPGTAVRLRDGSIETVGDKKQAHAYTPCSNRLYYRDNGVCNIDPENCRNNRDIVEVLEPPTPVQSESPIVTVEVPLSEYLSFFDDEDQVTLPVGVLKELV